MPKPAKPHEMDDEEKVLIEVEDEVFSAPGNFSQGLPKKGGKVSSAGLDQTRPAHFDRNHCPTGKSGS